MRRFDKNKQIKKANILAEQRHLESKGLKYESFHSTDGTPIPVNKNHEPTQHPDSDFQEPIEGLEVLTIVRIAALNRALEYYTENGDNDMIHRLTKDIEYLRDSLKRE